MSDFNTLSARIEQLETNLATKIQELADLQQTNGRLATENQQLMVKTMERIGSIMEKSVIFATEAHEHVKRAYNNIDGMQEHMVNILQQIQRQNSIARPGIYNDLHHAQQYPHHPYGQSVYGQPGFGFPMGHGYRSYGSQQPGTPQGYDNVRHGGYGRQTYPGGSVGQLTIQAVQASAQQAAQYIQNNRVSWKDASARFYGAVGLIPELVNNWDTASMIHCTMNGEQNPLDPFIAAKLAGFHADADYSITANQIGCLEALIKEAGGSGKNNQDIAVTLVELARCIQVATKNCDPSRKPLAFNRVSDGSQCLVLVPTNNAAVGYGADHIAYSSEQEWFAILLQDYRAAGTMGGTPDQALHSILASRNLDPSVHNTVQVMESVALVQPQGINLDKPLDFASMVDGVARVGVHRVVTITTKRIGQY